MKKIDTYRGKQIGDIIKINSYLYPTKKLAKILDIYKKGNNVRFIVKLAGNIKVDLHANYIIFDTEQKVCDCPLPTLMRSGCLCGGY